MNRAIRALSRAKFPTRAVGSTPSALSVGFRSVLAPHLWHNSSRFVVRSFSAVPERHEFQAETRKLLDIVTHSIYTDKEVFLRELISNASDALEKRRYQQTMGKVVGDGSPLVIKITTDRVNKTLTISDSGVGMNRDDLKSNLGTIARSGSKAFVEQVNQGGEAGSGDGIIGQFGVGFYSAFMVSDTVTFTSTPARIEGENDPETTSWSSDGSGQYTLEPAEAPAGQGSSIVMNLKDSCSEFCEPDRIKAIINKYSNFVSFPIELDGEAVNTVSAIWLQDKKEITEEQYDEFYRFIANAFDKPSYTLHFRTDAPLDMKVLLFFPSFHMEKFGMQRMEPGVNLYSRKVLIENKPKDLLPDWLRFVKGVVDSEDLPLSLSREKPQDTGLLKRIKDVLTRKIIRYLGEQAKNDPAKWKEFYTEHNYFLKEGICQDYQFQDQIAKLLMFESSKSPDTELCTFDDYSSRCPPEQKEIYYLVAPSREAALASPYMETFRKHDKEVLLLFTTIDEFVMSNLKTYNGRKLVSAETSAVNLADDDDEEGADKDGKDDSTTKKLSTHDADLLCGWLKESLGPMRVREVKMTNRLSDSPAIITDHESGALRRMMQMVDQANSGKSSGLPPQVLEINPKHPIILGLAAAQARGDEPSLGAMKLVSEQVLDNALVAAGLLDDPRSMLPRLYEILNVALKESK